MGSVQLDGVKSAVLGSSGRLAVFFDQLMDIFYAHFLGILPGKLHGSHSRGGERPLAGYAFAGETAAMGQLQADLGSAGVYGMGNPA